MSLLEWASPWENSPSPSSSSSKSSSQNSNHTNGNRKRPSTMRKSYNSSQFSTAASYQETNPDVERIDEELEEEKIIPNSIKSSQIINEQRNNNINKILEKMSNLQVTNDGSGLGDFNPPPRPIINNLNTNDNKNLQPLDLLPKAVSNVPSFSGPLNTGAGNVAGGGSSSGGGNYRPTEPFVFRGETAIEPSDYRKVYDPSSRNISYTPYYAKNAANGINSLNDDQLLKKINYMIHLLEEQRKEKTDNVMEEFILYSFLGIFIIYIVDSFSRSGKYIR